MYDELNVVDLLQSVEEYAAVYAARQAGRMALAHAPTAFSLL